MSATAVAVGTMKVAQISEPGAGFQIVEREIPERGAGQVRIKVNVCGVCHSDALVVEGSWPGISYPRIPGHEVAGVVDAVGVGVSEWKKGQRVAIGWHGGNDFTCPECRRGDFMNCRNQQVTFRFFDRWNLFSAPYLLVKFRPTQAHGNVEDEIAGLIRAIGDGNSSADEKVRVAKRNSLRSDRPNA